MIYLLHFAPPFTGRDSVNQVNPRLHFHDNFIPGTTSTTLFGVPVATIMSPGLQRHKFRSDKKSGTDAEDQIGGRPFPRQCCA